MGIEPTYPAWKAGVLPLNYTRSYEIIKVHLPMRAIDGARTRGLDLGKVARYQLRHYRIRAGDGNRTHVSSLEGWCSTIELHPRIVASVITDRLTAATMISI